MKKDISSISVKQSFFMISVLVLIFNTAVAHSAKVQLAWDPNTEPDLAGYKIYYGIESEHYLNTADAGNQTSHTLTLDPGTYYFALTAYNRYGESGYSNEISCTIPTSPNIPPTASAGSDQTVDQGILVRLSGSDSNDPDDGILSYHWYQTGGSDVTLATPSASETVFISPNAGTNGDSLVFSLTVTDHGGNKDTDSCVVWVNGIVEDNDNDNIPDYEDPDDDNDGISDLDEINVYGTDPYSGDSDGDGFLDDEEINEGSDPTDPDSIPQVEEIEEIFIPIADATVSSRKPSKNFGSNTQLKADGSPIQISLLKFNLAGFTGTVQSAYIRLEVSNRSSSGGTIHSLSDNNWKEETVTFNSCPVIDGPPLDNLGRVQVEDIVEFNVTSAINGTGPFSFAIVSENRNAVGYCSREDLSRTPELIIFTDEQSSSPAQPIMD